MGTHVVATGSPNSFKIAVCPWFSGIWCAHKLLKQFSTLYKSKMEIFSILLIFWPFTMMKYPM